MFRKEVGKVQKKNKQKIEYLWGVLIRAVEKFTAWPVLKMFEMQNDQISTSQNVMTRLKAVVELKLIKLSYFQSMNIYTAWLLHIILFFLHFP